jgi:hypothetical protein
MDMVLRLLNEVREKLSVFISFVKHFDGARPRADRDLPGRRVSCGRRPMNYLTIQEILCIVAVKIPIMKR